MKKFHDIIFYDDLLWKDINSNLDLLVSNKWCYQVDFFMSQHMYVVCSVLGLRTTMVCPNYEVVWSRTDPLLIQSGSNLGQRTTQP